MQRIIKISAILIGTALLMGEGAHSATAPPGAAARRMTVVQAAQKGAAGLPVLQAALKDSNPVIRRTAVRSLAQMGAPAIKLLSASAKNDADPLTRRIALQSLSRLAGDQSAALLAPALNDSSEMVRRYVVESLAAMHPQTPEVTALLKQAGLDKSPEISRIATAAMWPFYKETVSARNLPQFKDQQLKVAQTIPLPADNWRFQTDASENAHLKNWFAVNFDDSGWKTIGIEKTWEEFGPAYDGVAWYRRTFTLPEKPAQAAVDLSFGGVDESAWVWINGEYAGQHDIGPGGWDQPFSMDVTNLLKWGEPNQITVRVRDTMFAGGIWKPVNIEVLTR